MAFFALLILYNLFSIALTAYSSYSMFAELRIDFTPHFISITIILILTTLFFLKKKVGFFLTEIYSALNILSYSILLLSIALMSNFPELYSIELEIMQATSPYYIITTILSIGIFVTAWKSREIFLKKK